MSGPTIPDSLCYVLNTLLAAVVFVMPLFACTNPTIDWQAKAACFGIHVVLGTLSSYPT